MTLYFTLVIIFKMHYMSIAHLVNALFLGNFLILMFIENIKLKTNTIINIYLLFTFIVLASSLWGINFTNPSFKALQLFIIIINGIFIYNSMLKYDLKNTFLNGVLIGSLVNYLLILGIVPAPFPIIDQWGLRYFGTLGNANTLAIFMITSILVSMIYLIKEKEVSKVFVYYQYINIILALYVIFLTASKKGIASGLLLIFFFILLSIKNPKKLFMLSIFTLIGITVVVNYMNLDDLMVGFNRIIRRFSEFESQIGSESRFGSTGERKYFIQLGLNLFTDRPLFGYGLANFAVIAGKYSHNNFIELLVGVGLIGAITFYSIYLVILKKILEIKEDDMKLILFLFIVILLILDMARVSYISKYLMYTFIFISVLAEQNNRYQIKQGST